MAIKPSKKDRRKLKALLTMHDKMYDYYQTLQPETQLFLEAIFKYGTSLHLREFERNVSDTIKVIENGK